MEIPCRIALGCAALALGCSEPEPLIYGDTARTSGDEGEEHGAPPYCGDGVLQRSEQCDDGDDDDFNGCHNDCTAPGRTLWITELPGRSVEDLAPAAGRVYLAGWLGNEQWIGQLDAYGSLFPTPIHQGDDVHGLAVVDEDHVVFARGEGSPREICVYASGDIVPHCPEPLLAGKPAKLGPLDASLGRVASTSGWFGTAAAYHVGPDAELVGATKLAVEGSPDPRHAFTPEGHVFAYAGEDAIVLQWTTEDGAPTHFAELPAGETISESGIESGADGSIALLARPAVGPGATLRVFSADGQPRWSRPGEVAVRDYTLADNGDLLTVGKPSPDAMTLTRWTRDGELAWTRTWTDAGANAADVIAWGPDGNLYLGGTLVEEDPTVDPHGFVRAVRP